MDFMILQKWCHENYMVLNLGKFHHAVIGGNNPFHKIIMNNNEIVSSYKEKLLGIF